jgi:HEAT repeat protein
MRSLGAALLLGALLAAPAASAAEPDAADEQLLHAAGLATDGPALIQFFRLRSRTDADPAHLASLVRQLGDRAAEARAAAELIAWGPPAVRPLRRAVNDLNDAGIARRARDCLRAIEGPSGAGLVAAAARLLAARAPDGTADTLLAYLSQADDSTVTEAVTAALADIGYRNGQADPALIRALADSVPVRRAIAAMVLCRADHPDLLPAVRRLLADPKPAVRSRVALALARQRDVEAFPVLIDLLAVLPAGERRPIEEALQDIAGEWAPGLPALGEDVLSRRLRREVWAAWWRTTDGPELLDAFRKRTLTPETMARMRILVRRLGDASYRVRAGAAADLAGFGHMALPILRAATRDPDAEVARQAATIVERIEQGPNDALPATAARLIALRKPAGAAEVLLAYLPSTDSEEDAAAVETALAAVAVRDGKPDSALLRALDDASGRRRAAAGEALCRAGNLEGIGAVRRLLQDADLSVRMRVATALTAAGQKEAVPVLIDLIALLPREQSWQAQDMLTRLVGEGAPQVVTDDAPGRKKARDAWLAWWKDNADRVNLSARAAEPATLGYTDVVLVEDGGMGRVAELGRDGKVRWQIEGLQYPVDAWVLPGNRVLVGEYNGMKVTERDLAGKVVWERANLGGRVVNVQRLTNGHTFIALQNALLEVDRSGRQVARRDWPGGDLWAAFRSADGSITCFSNTRSCVRLDRTGKEVKSFAINAGGGWTSGIDVTVQGRILVSNTNNEMVQEFDGDGKLVWEARAPGITTATRAPNGRIIVASYITNRVFELDRNGKVVWEHRDALHPFRARRR